MNQASKTSWQLYRQLFCYLKPYWFYFSLAMAGNVLYSAVDAGFTYLLKPVLNKGFVDRDIYFIKWLPFLIIFAFILRGGANFLSSYFISRVSRGMIMDIRQTLFQRLLRLPASYYDHSSSGTILSALFYNTEQVADAGSDALTDFVQSLCLILGLLFVMFSISWRLSLLYLIAVPIVAGSVRWSSRRLRKLSLQLQKRMASVLNIAEEAIEGYQVVRGFGGQVYEEEKFKLANRQNYQGEIKSSVTKTLGVSGIQLIVSVILAFTVYLATAPSAARWQLTAGDFVSLIAAMLALLKPLKDFASVNNKIQRGLAGAESVFALLGEPLERDEGKISVERVRGEIIFDHLSFTYPKTDRDVLKNINFTIKPGQTIALVGHSGGGKSTLVKLLQRFYEKFSGNILMDGVNIFDYKLDNFRQQFAVVSQQVTLFNDSLRHNIAYGKFAEIAEEKVIQAAKMAHAWEFIEQLPEKLETRIGENGVLLSGGQRQRIAIARAILKDAPILLLDEATSSLDTESERYIQAALSDLMVNRTTIVIAHRLSTIEKADQIIVLEKGEIVEIGNHNALLSIDRHYARLYKMQFRDE